MISGVLIPLEQLRESSFYQYILEEGRKEGIRDILRPLLEQRFGALPDWASEKIEAADQEALEKWSILALDAPSLEDALAS
jgi:hypothetical protein